VVTVVSDLTKEKQGMTFYDAIEIYLKWFADESRLIYRQPSRSSFFYSHGAWYLGNINGLLAKVGCRSRKVFWPTGCGDSGETF
jgi:hypothetical protein